MCRLCVYIGPPALVADVVLWPDRSIIKQVLQAKCRPAHACSLGVPEHACILHKGSAHCDRGCAALQSYDARERIMDASLPQHLAHGNLNGEQE